MGIRRSCLRLTLAVSLGLFGVGTTSAIDNWDSTTPDDDTALDTNNVLIPGDAPQRHDAETIAAVADEDWYRLVVVQGHSYEVRVGGRQDECFDFEGLNFQVFESDGATLITTGVDFPLTGAISSFRATFIAPSSQNTFVRLVGLPMTGPASCTSTSEYTIQFFDTTLINPAWSSFGSFETFYSIHNTGSSTINGTLTLFDTAGTQVVSVPIIVAPGLTVSTNTDAEGVADNLNGAARFTHDGSPGDIIAEAAIASFAVAPGVIQPVKFQLVSGGN